MPHLLSIELETGGACDFRLQLGLRARIDNVGNGPAGRFVVVANGRDSIEITGLGPGESVTVWLPGYVYLGINSVVVDATSLVTESNENNNVEKRFVPVPTLPPTCTPTPR